MIIYSVTTSVLSAKEGEWVEWMQEKHIPKVMATGYFTGFHFNKLLDPQPEPGTATYNVQYTLASFSDYHYYVTKDAPALREDHESRFGKQALSFRTVLKNLDASIPSPTPSEN